MFPTNGLKVKKEENKNLNKTVPILRKGYRPENVDDDSDEEIINKNEKDKKINNEIDEDEEIKRLKNKLKEIENKKNQIKNNNNISEIIKTLSKEKESIKEIEYEEQIININDIIQNEKEEEQNLLKEKNEKEENKTKKIMSKREKDLLKKYVENNSSEEESEENEEEEEEESVPIFISSNSRNQKKQVNNNNNEDIENENEKIIKRKKEDNINNLIKQEKDKKTNNKESELKKENNDLLNIMPDDTDNPDDQIEYENWKIRELNRIKRQMEEKEIKKKEQKEIERRRNLTDEQRKEENLKLGSDSTIRNFKSKIKYLQKYYHKGAFFQDEAYNNSEHIYNRDFNLPTWEDSIDRSNVPGIMEKRRGNLFKKGQSKYTHLTNEDTTDFNPDFRIPDNINNNLLKKIGGYKGKNKFDGK
jgi:microfibrillar-associated protein 1